MSVHQAFLRYRPIVDDWDAFADALRHPLPLCLWTNTLRTTPQRLAHWLADAYPAITPLRWTSDAFRLPKGARPGNHLAYLAGHCHIQEEVSMLPVALLAPQPGERILDLCAAPGNKTAQIAIRMQNGGTVVANDRNRHRLKVLFATLSRLGLANVTTTTYDAANYPKESGLFDRVLVDVPCSCEGTSRKNPNVCDNLTSPSFRRMTHLQRAILRKAVQRCKPGGRIVYATCTYAPEENEQVVDAVLREYDTTLRLRPIHFDGIVAAPGLTAWREETYHPSLRHTRRIWPQQNDSGGFFIAVLEKEGAAGPSSHT